MKKYILTAIFSLCVLLSPAFVSPVEAAGLTTAQATSLIELVKASPNTPSSAFVSLITSFSRITTAQATSLIELIKASPSTPTSNFVSVILTFSSDTGSSDLTASLTVNGQTSVTGADPMATRTWAWSGTPGATYTASADLTECEVATENGHQSGWTPWTDTGATGNATSGSTSAIPGTVKYGCIIVGTYNVTKDGNTTTATSTITYKHKNDAATYNLTVSKAGTGAGTVTSAPTGTTFTSGASVTLTATPDAGSTFAGWSGACANTTGTCAVTMSGDKSVTATFNLSSGLQITSENLPAGDIPAPPHQQNTNDIGLGYTTTLTYTGGTGTPVWSLVQEDGKLPGNLTLNKDTGVISGSIYDVSWALSGIYYFTVKLTVGSDVVTKRLSILMNSFTVASASQIKILTTTLPPAVVGKPYYATIAVNPGVGVSNNSWVAIWMPYTNFQKIPGFPEGLVMDGGTGVISGIPVRVGTTSFYVTVGHKPGQADGSGDSMYYTIPVASSPDVTKLVSIKKIMGNDIGHVNNGVTTDIYQMVTTANFSDGSLVGQKIIYRQLGELRNRVIGFSAGGYCLQKVSPWSDEGTVPGITVRDLASKSFPATKVHTYGIEYQINPAGVYEFAAVATSVSGSTFKSTNHMFIFNRPDGGDLSQADWLKLPLDQRNVPSTCTYNGQSYNGVVNDSSAVVAQSFEEEVQNGWGGDSATNMCTDWTYSSTYGACQSNGTQSKTIVSASPAGCTGGTPQVPTQSCTYTGGSQAGSCTTGSHPSAGNGVVLYDYSNQTVGGASNTEWKYSQGGGSCVWSCTAPMIQNGDLGCKNPTPGTGTTITIHKLDGGSVSGISLTPSDMAAYGPSVAGSPFFTDINGKTPEFWFRPSGIVNESTVGVDVPGYKIRNATGAHCVSEIWSNRKLSLCGTMSNGTPIVINMVPGDIASTPEILLSQSAGTLSGRVVGGDPKNTWACIDSPITPTNRKCDNWSPSWRQLTVPYDGHADEWRLVETNYGDTIELSPHSTAGYPAGTYTQYVKTGQYGTVKTSTSFTLTASQSQQSAPALSIATLSPSSGTVGTTVTIRGSGFTGTNQIYLDGFSVDTLNTSGGSTPTWISFVVPTYLPSCPTIMRPPLCVDGSGLQTGSHSVKVQNTNGTSNTVSFVVN